LTLADQPDRLCSRIWEGIVTFTRGRSLRQIFNGMFIPALHIMMYN